MKILNRKLNVVIVAGASGIGREIAAAYDREKCNVFVCDISDSFIQSFTKDYPNIFIKKADVSVYDDVAKFLERTYDDLKGQILVIHTKNNGDLYEKSSELSSQFSKGSFSK